MRFRFHLKMENNYLPKDKNRVVVSIIKSVIEKHNPDLYNQIYGEGSANRKQYSFSLFLPNASFMRDYIYIPSKEFNVTFTIVNNYIVSNIGQKIYDSLLCYINKKIRYKNTEMTISKIEMLKEKTINANKIAFHTLSPIAIREHNVDDNTDYYYVFGEEGSYKEFLENLKIQLLDVFPDKKKDIDQIKFQVYDVKTVKVKHYGYVIPSCLCTLRFDAEPYLLNHMYQSGIGSHSSAGFGMLTIKK